MSATCLHEYFSNLSGEQEAISDQSRYNWPSDPMRNWHKNSSSGKEGKSKQGKSLFHVLTLIMNHQWGSFPAEFWLRRPYSLSVSATTGPCPFISGWVTIKSQRSVMTSAVVALFGSEGYVQFTQCCQSYRGWQQRAIEYSWRRVPCHPPGGHTKWETTWDHLLLSLFQETGSDIFFLSKFWRQMRWPMGESLSDHCIFLKRKCILSPRHKFLWSVLRIIAFFVKCSMGFCFAYQTFTVISATYNDSREWFAISSHPKSS